jgi:hypothetical protein
MNSSVYTCFLHGYMLRVRNGKLELYRNHWSNSISDYDLANLLILYNTLETSNE